MKPIKFFSIALVAVFTGTSAFALPSIFNSKLSATDKAKLERGETVIRSLKSVKEFSITTTNSKISDAQETETKICPKKFPN